MPFVMGGEVDLWYCGPGVGVGICGGTGFNLQWIIRPRGCWQFMTIDRGGCNSCLVTGFSDFRMQYICVPGGTMIVWVATDKEIKKKSMKCSE